MAGTELNKSRLHQLICGVIYAQLVLYFALPSLQNAAAYLYGSKPNLNSERLIFWVKILYLLASLLFFGTDLAYGFLKGLYEHFFLAILDLVIAISSAFVFLAIEMNSEKSPSATWISWIFCAYMILFLSWSICRLAKENKKGDGAKLKKYYKVMAGIEGGLVVAFIAIALWDADTNSQTCILRHLICGVLVLSLSIIYYWASNWRKWILAGKGDDKTKVVN